MNLIDVGESYVVLESVYTYTFIHAMFSICKSPLIVN